MTARKDGYRITFLRLPADLREQVDRAAAEGFRPMASEIEMRLRRSFAQREGAPVNPAPDAGRTSSPLSGAEPPHRRQVHNPTSGTRCRGGPS